MALDIVPGLLGAVPVARLVVPVLSPTSLFSPLLGLNLPLVPLAPPPPRPRSFLALSTAFPGKFSSALPAFLILLRISRPKFAIALPSLPKAFPSFEPTLPKTFFSALPTLMIGPPILASSFKPALKALPIPSKPNLSKLPALFNNAKAIFKKAVILLPFAMIHMSSEPNNMLVKNFSGSNALVMGANAPPTIPAAPFPASSKLSLSLFFSFSAALRSAFLLLMAVCILAAEVFFNTPVKAMILSS